MTDLEKAMACIRHYVEIKHTLGIYIDPQTKLYEVSWQDSVEVFGNWEGVIYFLAQLYDRIGGENE